MPRPTILTQAALAHVTSLVGQGQSAAQIASDAPAGAIGRACRQGTGQLARQPRCCLIPTRAPRGAIKHSSEKRAPKQGEQS
jgi:hypothetical protein